jgi:hypothetical protein
MRLPRLLPLLLLSVLCRAQSGGLPVREKITYRVEWRLITAGRVQLNWSPNQFPRNGWSANMHVESAGLVSTLFRVEDDYNAQLSQNLCAESVFSTSHEGIRQRETRVTFDKDQRKASYLERDRARNTVVASSEIETPSCVHDVLGGLYQMRTLSLEPGQSAQIPVSDGKRAVMARVEAQQRETVRTPAGTFNTIRYEANLFNNVLYRRAARVYVWLSDDRRRLPVQIQVRMQFTVGTITLQAEKIE